MRKDVFSLLVALRMKKEAGIFAVLVILCIAITMKNPNFISPGNLQNLARMVGMYGIFSVGVGLIIISGGIDLSVGSVFALTGVLLPMMLREFPWFGGQVGWPWPVAAAVALLIPVIIGLYHGALVTLVGLQPLIVTLCGLLYYRGLARFIADGGPKGFSNAEGFEAFQSLAEGDLFGIPMPFIILIIVALIMWVILHRTVYGRYLMAVGQDEVASRSCGINTKLMIGSAYAVAGVLIGISGILFAFYANTVSAASHGNFYELFGIAAAVLGGCSLRGGKGSVIGIIIGVMILQVLQNSINLLGIESTLESAVIGFVLLNVVLADHLIQRRRSNSER